MSLFIRASVALCHVESCTLLQFAVSFFPSFRENMNQLKLKLKTSTENRKQWAQTEISIFWILLLHRIYFTKCVYLQSVDMYGCSTCPVHRVVSFIWRLLSFFRFQSFFLWGHFGFLLFDQFGTVQYHLQRKRGHMDKGAVSRGGGRGGH